MVRKSKQAGGHMPLTAYERTKKFASSEYGTTTKRLAGHSQYQLGNCALSLTPMGTEALCTPSGYLYAPDAILEYMLTKTQELKEQKAAYDRQEDKATGDGTTGGEQKKRVQAFEDSQKVIKKRKHHDEKEAAKTDLKRTSYWLAEAQPDVVDKKLEAPPSRPLSPVTQQPLRRKDIWPVALQWQDGNEKKLTCAVSGKTIHAQSVTVYWTNKKKPGTLVLSDVYKKLVEPSGVCPQSGKKIKYTRQLQRSGSSFAAGGQNVEAKQYKPTIT